MFTKMLNTGNNKILATVRALLGFVLIAEGAHGLLGWFSGTVRYDSFNSFLRLIGLPAPLIWLAVLTDFLAGTGILVGFLTRISALIVVVDASVAILLRGIAPGLFTNWSITQGGIGFGYFFLIFALALIPLIKGAGPLSLDRLLLRRKSRTGSPQSLNRTNTRKGGIELHRAQSYLRSRGHALFPSLNQRRESKQ